MITSKLDKRLITVLSLLVVVTASGLGMVLLDDTHQAESALLPLVAESERCLASLIYTSLPPRCKTIDGTFVQLGEMSPGMIVLPERK